MAQRIGILFWWSCNCFLLFLFLRIGCFPVLPSALICLSFYACLCFSAFPLSASLLFCFSAFLPLCLSASLFRSSAFPLFHSSFCLLPVFACRFYACLCYCFSALSLGCFFAFPFLCLYASLFCSTVFLIFRFAPFSTPILRSRHATLFSCPSFWFHYFHSAPKH